MSAPGKLPGFDVAAGDLIATAQLLLSRKPQLEKLVERKRYEVSGLRAHGFTTYDDAAQALSRVNAIAGKLLQDAISLNPTDIDCLNLLAGLYRDGGDMQAAYACDRMALELQPEHLTSRRSAARSLLGLGRRDEAIDAVAAMKAIASTELECLAMTPFHEWAQAAGTMRVLNRAEPFTRPLVGALEGKTMAIDHVVEQAPLCVVEARDLVVVDGYIPVRDRSAYVFEYGLDVLRGRSELAGRDTFIHRKNAQSAVVEEPCIYLTGVEWHLQNYYHALVQNFSRLALLLDRPEYAGRRVALPASIRPWGVEFLEAMGVPRERLVLLQNRTDTTLRDAVVPIMRRVPSQDEIDALRRRLGVDRARQGRKRLFLGRRVLAAHTRFLVNEIELADVARQHGFEEVDPGAMTIGQQIELFSDAVAVCGPNGAAFANLLYAPDSASATCLSPWETLGTWYPDLAALCNQRFYWCFGRFLPEGRNSRLIPKVPYYIDAEDFGRLLEMALEGAAPDGLSPAIAGVTQPD